MAKEVDEKEKEMRDNKLILENKRFVKKYGLTRKELEIIVQDNLKFGTSFLVASDFLEKAKYFLEERKESKAIQLMEIAKYVLKGCSE